MADEGSVSVQSERPPAMRCANHPSVETHLRCSKCGKPICPKCVIPTPVGGRCRQCAGLRRAPMFTVGPSLFARAFVSGWAAATLAGLVWASLGGAFGLASLLLLLVGYVVGDAVSRGARGRVSRSLSILAGSLVLYGALAGRAVIFFMRLPDQLSILTRLEAALTVSLESLVGNLFGLLFLVLAIVVAASRVR